MAPDDKDPLPGHETLSMADQMRAAGISDRPTTDPKTGAVVNKRREHLKNAIAYKANQWERKQK